MPDSGLASLADARVLYLTTVGRRSGQPRTIEIWFTCYQGKLYLNAERAQNANWVRNMQQHPEVQVRLEEQQCTGRARVLDRQAGHACRVAGWPGSFWMAADKMALQPPLVGP
jgi:deazaflavin-dependent oxidoreductase (nitroreductase family)